MLSALDMYAHQSRLEIGTAFPTPFLPLSSLAQALPPDKLPVPFQHPSRHYSCARNGGVLAVEGWEETRLEGLSPVRGAVGAIRRLDIPRPTPFQGTERSLNRIGHGNPAHAL